MRTIYILRGISGAGKSTWAKQLLAAEPNRFKRINRDDIRMMLDNGVYSASNEKFVVKIQDELIRNTLSEGYDVIVDNTHLVASTLKKLHLLCEDIGDVTVVEKCFNIDVTEAHLRNSRRAGQACVPAKVIDDMVKSLYGKKLLVDKQVYYPPRSGHALVKQDEKLPKAIICDIDGTLAVVGDRSPYDASKCDDVDKPNQPVIECVKAMHSQGYHIIFMSGREDEYRDQTINFICDHVRVHYDPEDNSMFSEGPINFMLYMRTTGDKRKDAIVKRELFDAHVAGKYFVEFVLDDRNQVVKFWRSIGLPCFQVAEGMF